MSEESQPKAPATKRKGRFREARLGDLCDGEFQAGIEDCIREAVRALEAHERKTGKMDGKVTGTIAFAFERGEDTAEFLTLDFETKVKAPKNRVSKLVRHGNGRLLFDPENGEGSINGKDQQPLFNTYDRFGHAVETVNAETGEVVPATPKTKAA